MSKIFIKSRENGGSRLGFVTKFDEGTRCVYSHHGCRPRACAVVSVQKTPITKKLHLSDASALSESSSRSKKRDLDRTRSNGVVAASSGSDARNQTSTEDPDVKSTPQERRSADKQRSRKSAKRKDDEGATSSSSHDKGSQKRKDKDKSRPTAKESKKRGSGKGSAKKKEKARESSAVDESPSSQASLHPEDPRGAVPLASSSDELASAHETRRRKPSRDNGRVSHSPTKRASPAKTTKASSSSPVDGDWTGTNAMSNSTSNNRGPIVWKAPSRQQPPDTPSGTSFSSVSPFSPEVSSFAADGGKNAFAKSNSHDLLKANSKVQGGEAQVSILVWRLVPMHDAGCWKAKTRLTAWLKRSQPPPALHAIELSFSCLPAPLSHRRSHASTPVYLWLNAVARWHRTNAW